MQITAVRMGYPSRNNYNIKTNNSKTPSFTAGLSNLEADTIIQALAKKNTEVIDNFSEHLAILINKIKMDLIYKYKDRGVNSVGLMVVGNNDLPKLLGKDISKYDTRGKIGLCVAAGDINGPVERMQEIYEARTILTSMDALKKPTT